jgi:hypothetical protein
MQFLSSRNNESPLDSWKFPLFYICGLSTQSKLSVVVDHEFGSHNNNPI